MATEIKHTATETDLSLIHSLTADLMKQRLLSALETGEPLPPAELAAITKFLKDNNIQCTKGDMEKKFGKVLEMKLPEFAEVEEKFG